MTLINICIATYNRNDGLTVLLESLRKIEHVPSNDVSLQVLVIDNNPDGRAKPVVEVIQGSDYPMPISYFHETRPGVSHVRNTAVTQSAGMGFIAFLDDDEYVTPQWFKQLWRIYQETKAAVVFGPSIASYPEKTPQWMLQGDYHSCLIEKSGLRSLPSSIANCLIDLEVFRRHKLEFDTAISEIGGEDTLLFTQMLDLGEVLADASKAIVYETVPPSRVIPGWLYKRWRRTGSTDAMVKHKGRSPLAGRILALFEGMLRILVGGLLSSFWYLASGLTMTTRVADRIFTFQRGLGMVDYARGQIIREYSHIKI